MLFQVKLFKDIFTSAQHLEERNVPSETEQKELELSESSRFSLQMKLLLVYKFPDANL